MAHTTDRPPLVWVLAGGLLTVVVSSGVWIALAGQLDGQDLVAGVITGALAAGIGYFVSQRGDALPSFRRGDVRRIAAFPYRIVVESVQVFVLAARQAVGRTGPGGSWVHVPVEAGGGGWQAARRDSVLTALLSVAPTTIVVDIDADSGVALVHRLGGERISGDVR